MANIEDMIKGILSREGVYVDHPADKGGPTKFGITQGTLSGWRHEKVTVQAVKHLSIEEAVKIYKKLYVQDPGFLRLGDDALAEQLIDAGVNHGTGQAIKLLQRAVGADVDGEIGPQTIGKVNSMPPSVVYIKFMTLRLRYFASILQGSVKQLVFAAGWMNRCALTIELYVRAVPLDQAHRTVLWDTAVYLRARARVVQQKAANRPLAIGWFQRAAGALAKGT